MLLVIGGYHGQMREALTKALAATEASAREKFGTERWKRAQREREDAVTAFDRAAEDFEDSCERKKDAQTESTWTTMGTLTIPACEAHKAAAKKAKKR